MTAKRWGIALALGLTACQSQDPCAPTSTPCGGNPVGDWTVVAGCREAVYTPPLPITYDNQPATMSRQPPPEPTSSDWCSNLLLKADGTIQNFTFPHDTLFTNPGTLVRYGDNGAYSVSLSLSGAGHVDLSATCLQRFGSVPSCDDLTTRLDAIAPGQGIDKIACSSDGDNGCLCTYEILPVPGGGSATGSFSVSGSVITHFDTANLQTPTQADFCADPSSGTLTLWGHDQTDLWNSPGLRRLDTQRQ
jgi:hypothetical protein